MAAPGFGQKEPFPGFPPPLTTRPEGLLSMLGLQSNGRYPQHLAMDWLQPTLDLLPWYLESRASIESVSSLQTNVALGDVRHCYQVPTQEVWVLLNWTIQTTAVQQAQTVQLCRYRANDSLSRIALSPATAVGPTILPLIGTEAAVRGLVLRPTVQLGIQNVSGSGTANTFNSCLRVVKCTI